MNPVINEAREAVMLGWLLGGMTLVFLLAFIGWTAWAWWPSRRAAMDEAARMPLEEDDA